jgi:hypothetical protein
MAKLSPAKRRWLWIAGVAGALVLFYFSIFPSNDRDWSTDQSRLPRAAFDGRMALVNNVRNFTYRSTTDYDPAWFDAAYDLDKLETLWFVVEPFGVGEGAAHTFLSFGFSDGQFLAVSVEIRKEKGESFSAILGLLRKYELMYVVGTERDLIGLRAAYRKDQVFLYPIKAHRERIEALLVSMLERANALAERPEFYNTLTNTCTTNIVRHLNAVAEKPISPWRLSILLPGHADKLAYGRGLIATDLPFEQAKQTFNISKAATKYADSAKFSRRIREKLPVKP